MRFGYDQSIKGNEHNPEKAKALLKGAGYDKGFDFDIWQFWVTRNDSNQAAMGYLAKLGIKLNVRTTRGTPVR